MSLQMAKVACGSLCNIINASQFFLISSLLCPLACDPESNQTLPGYVYFYIALWWGDEGGQRNKDTNLRCKTFNLSCPFCRMRCHLNCWNVTTHKPQPMHLQKTNKSSSYSSLHFYSALVCLLTDLLNKRGTVNYLYFWLWKELFILFYFKSLWMKSSAKCLTVNVTSILRT